MEDSQGRVREVTALVDSCSSISYINQKLANKPRRRAPGEDKRAFGAGTMIDTGECVWATVVKFLGTDQEDRVSLPACVPSASAAYILKDGEDVLLSYNHMVKLQLDVSYHNKHFGQLLPARFLTEDGKETIKSVRCQWKECDKRIPLGEKTTNGKPKNACCAKHHILWKKHKKLRKRSQKATHSKESGKLNRRTLLISCIPDCNNINQLLQKQTPETKTETPESDPKHSVHNRTLLMDSQVAAFLKAHPEYLKNLSKPNWDERPVEDCVNINSELPPQIKERIVSIIQSKRLAFQRKADGELPIVMTDAKPIRFDIIPGKEEARARCKEPNWGPTTRKVLTVDALQKLRTGECIRPEDHPAMSVER